jgi:hypothetical protein
MVATFEWWFKQCDESKVNRCALRKHDRQGSVKHAFSEPLILRHLRRA